MSASANIKGTDLQRRRLLFQISFFLLFVLAPPLDLLRFDLTQGHFYFFGMPWRLGIDALISGDSTPLETGLNIILFGFVPIAVIASTFIWVSWNYGRLYCGWLCPHFSVVELINKMMRRAGGKHSLWDKETLPELQPDGRQQAPNKKFWPLTWLIALFFAFLWSLSLLSYLLPPFELYHNLWNWTLTINQFRFLLVGTCILFIEFMFARHLFCRFGCAVGLFQSLAWMANDKALVVGFDKERSELCSSDCNNACDNVCPMRLRPRTIKRHMFTCTECTQCITACEQVQARNSGKSLLHWVQDEAAIAVAKGGRLPRDGGEPTKKPSPDTAKFSHE